MAFEVINTQVRQTAEDAALLEGHGCHVRFVDLASLSEEDFYVRYHATMALGELGDARAVEVLEELRGDDSVRSVAEEALVKLRANSEGKP